MEWSPPDDQKLSKDDAGDSLDNNDNGEQSHGGSESISSTDGVPAHGDVQAAIPVAVAYHSKLKPQCTGIQMAYKKTGLKLVCGFSIFLFTIFTSLLWIDDRAQGSYLVPT